MSVSRRSFLQTVSGSSMAVALAGRSFLPTTAFAQTVETVDTDELYKPVPLGDKILGAEDAPVTIVEYASLTCGHCAHFHKTTYPDLKKQYIDTGKVRFIMREYPLENVALAAAALTRCAPEDKYFDVVDVMFEEQRSWALTQDVYNSLLNFSKQIGFTQETFEACLTNQDVLAGVNEGKQRAAGTFGVNSTPTFFINGEKHPGALSFDEMSKIIDGML